MKYRPLYTAKEVATLTEMSVNSVRYRAAKEPERWGVVRFGRAMLFRKVQVTLQLGLMGSGRIAQGDTWRLLD